MTITQFIITHNILNRIKRDIMPVQVRNHNFIYCESNQHFFSQDVSPKLFYTVCTKSIATTISTHILSDLFLTMQ